MKKISVIVAVYNAEKYIENCVNSILNQTYPNIEILLINDGSTDNSLSICQSLANNHSNVILIDKENGGCFSAWNEGLKNVSGDIIGFVDNDDYILPCMYEKMVKIMEDEKADIVGCGRYRNIEYRNDYEKMDLKDERLFSFSGEEAVRHLFSDTSLIKPAVWDKLYKKEIIIGEKFPNTYFEDAAVTYKLLLRARKIVITRKQFYAYSVRDGSMITSPWKMNKTCSYDFITNEAIKYLENNNKQLVPYARYWQIQFGIEAWERCKISDLSTIEDYKIIRNNIKQSYALMNIKDLGFGFMKRVKKKLEFFLFRYMPNVLCIIKNKSILRAAG